MGNTINSILELVYPPTCGFCGKLSKEYICNKCYLKIKKYRIKDNCPSKNVYFQEIYSIFKYEEDIRDILIKYKFQNKSYIYKTFSQIILKDEKIYGILKKYDIIIPVPVHKKRKNERGYNQTELIAREIAKGLNIKMEKDVLIKSINTKAQSSLSKEERRDNIKGAFKAQNLQKIKDKNILVIDDIYTTGSTINECGRILKSTGAKSIGALTIAKDYKKAN